MDTNEFGVYAPINQKFKIICEIIKGCLGRSFNNDKYIDKLALSSSLVKQFFNERSSSNNFSDFTDSSSEWYLSLLVKSPLFVKLMYQDRYNILDVGCGRAKLLKWLVSRYNSQIISYLGIDIDEIAIKKCSESNIYQKASFAICDVQEEDQIKKINKKFNLLFCINLLPYIVDLEIFIKNISNLLSKPCYLLIIDPAPSPYWEVSFGGFSIKIREEEEVITAVKRYDFCQSEIGRLYTMKLISISAFHLSTMLIFKLNNR